MGDGRYYTWFQFFNILILTFLLIFIVIGITFFYLKSKMYHSKKILFYSGILICICLTFTLLDEAVHILSLSRIFKTAFISIFFVLVYLRLYYLTTENFNYIIKILIRVFAALIVSAIVSNPFHGSFFIVYDFNKIQISLYFEIFIALTLSLLLVLSIADLFFRSNDYDFRSRLFLSTATFVQIAAVFTYFLGLFSSNWKIYIYITPVTFIFIGLAMFKYSPEFYLPNSYRDAVEDLNELILICNKHGKISYSNKSFFITQIDLTQIVFKYSLDSIFKGFSGIIREETDEQLEYRLYNSEKEFIINVYIHKLCSRNGEGYVYRFVDRTPFYNNLRDLQEKNRYLNLINKELLKYSQEVEQLDSEKERNKLLYDVQKVLGHKITELIKMLESIESIDVDLPYYINTIEHAIKNARGSLKTIRETVNKFKESYEVSKID